MAIFNVSNAAQLQSALTSAQGGDRITLAAGDYGDVTISNRNYSSNVIIQAQAGVAKAEFDRLHIVSSKNLTVVGVDIGRALVSGEPDYTSLAGISKSSNIKLSGIKLHGSLDDNPANDGMGLTIRESSNVNVSNSTFQELYRGIAVLTGTNVTIQNNDIKGMRSDGVVVTATDGIVLEGNRFSEFKPVLPDHADFIQFWNTGQTRGQSNITIKNNVMMQNYYSGVENTGVQGIFIADPLSYGYKNILIQNNLIWSNDQYNGITVAGGNGVQILGNSVLSKSTDAKQLWIRLESTDRVRVEDNLTDNILLVKNVTNLVQANNINFSLTPALRSLVPNLDAPANANDLFVADAGYEVRGLLPLSPVSSAAASSLGGLLSGATGNAVSQQAVSAAEPVSALSTSSTLDLSNVHSAMVAATPVADAGPALPTAAEIFAPAIEAFVAPHHDVPMFVRYAAFQDHFTALP